MINMPIPMAHRELALAREIVGKGTPCQKSKRAMRAPQAPEFGKQSMATGVRSSVRKEALVQQKECKFSSTSGDRSTILPAGKTTSHEVRVRTSTPSIPTSTMLVIPEVVSIQRDILRDDLEHGEEDTEECCRMHVIEERVHLEACIIEIQKWRC